MYNVPVFFSLGGVGNGIFENVFPHKLAGAEFSPALSSIS